LSASLLDLIVAVGAGGIGEGAGHVLQHAEAVRSDLPVGVGSVVDFLVVGDGRAVPRFAVVEHLV
jgi:hypothetical protein